MSVERFILYLHITIFDSYFILNIFGCGFDRGVAGCGFVEVRINWGLSGEVSGWF